MTYEEIAQGYDALAAEMLAKADDNSYCRENALRLATEAQRVRRLAVAAEREDKNQELYESEHAAANKERADRVTHCRNAEAIWARNAEVYADIAAAIREVGTKGKT